MFKISIFGFLFISLILSACASNTHNGDPLFTPSLHTYKEDAFQKEKSRVLAQDSSANFNLLRLSYTHTRQYQPWESREHEAGLVLLEAHQSGDFALCITIAEALLKLNFTSLMGHFGGAACYSALGDTNKSTFHTWVLQGLISSIRSSGDGISIDTPFVCNSPTEMRDFVRMLGLLMYRQDYVDSGPKQIERVHAINTNDENITLYFDTTVARMHSFRTNNTPSIKNEK